MSYPEIAPLGDSMVTVTFGEGISEELNRLVVARSRDVATAAMIGVSDIVASYAAVGIHYDPLVIAYADLRDRLLSIFAEPSVAGDSLNGATLHSIKVRYDGEDIAEVAQRTGLSVSDVISIHSEREYRVYVTGFVPGFAYLGVLDERLALPRRDSPRSKVPAGSVAIAERQTGIYPSMTPGGWHIIGNTDVRLFDPAREAPALFRAGDLVRFEPP